MNEKHREEYYERTKEHMKQVRFYVSRLLDSHNMFLAYKRITTTNEEIQDPFDFHNWIQRLFWPNVAMGIRNQLDKGPKAVSLWNVLVRLSKHPEIFSLSRYTSLWGEDSLGIQLSAKPHFKRQFCGSGLAHIDPGRVEADQKILGTSAGRVVDVADRRFAHIDERGLNEIVLFPEVEEALEVLGGLTRKYASLFLENYELDLPPGHYWPERFKIFLKPWTNVRILQHLPHRIRPQPPLPLYAGERGANLPHDHNESVPGGS